MYTASVVTRSAIGLCAVLALAAVGCGVPSTKTVSASSALTATAEWLEYETPAMRHELFHDVVKQSQQQVGRAGTVMFPMLVDGAFVGAPSLDTRLDLLGATDAGASILLEFDRAEPFAEDRRDAFQGLSEREVAEQVARSLLTHWRVPQGAVSVVRAAGAPYAAAYMHGELRLNPAFIYMAAAPSTP